MEYFTRLRNFWFPDVNALWWLLFALPVLYFFQTVVHEGSHTMAARFASGSWPTLAPFPHLTRDDKFLNGVTLTKPGNSTDAKPVPSERQNCDSEKKTPNPRLAGWIGMPQAVDLALVFVFMLIFFFFDIRSPMARFLLRAWYLGACIDFMFNTSRNLIGGCKPTQDWSRVMLRGDIGEGSFILLTWLLWLFILSHFAWVYSSKWGRSAAEETGFWDYRWVALFLGLLSLLAIVLSLTIGDHRINKHSAAFMLPFIVQVIACGWYWTYFILTFKHKDKNQQQAT